MVADTREVYKKTYKLLRRAGLYFFNKIGLIHRTIRPLIQEFYPLIFYNNVLTATCTYTNIRERY